MTAIFKTEGTSTVTGRGVVLFGTIQDGVAKIGMSFTIPGIENRLRISGIESVNHVSPERGIVGLVCDGIPDADFSAWAELDVGGLEVIIDDEST